jgi:hypothetical protein
MEKGMIRISSAFAILALLAACSEIHYSDSAMSNVESLRDDQKGGHPDEPIAD